MIDIWSDIWVGDWLEKVKEQNRLLSGQKATSLTPQEKAVWTNFEIQGRKQFDKYHPGENWNSAQGAAYFANTYILQQRAARKSLSAKESAAAASAAAAQAAANQATAQKSAQAAEASKASAAAASKAAAAQAAAAQAAQKQAQAEKSAAAAAASKDSAAAASAAAAAQAAAAAAIKEAQEKAAEAQKASEDWAVEKAKLEARIAQEQAAKEAAQEQAAQAQQVIYYSTDTGPASTAANDSGENMDNNLTLQPVAVQGTNLRNSLLLVGGVAFIWWLFKKRKRGR